MHFDFITLLGLGAVALAAFFLRRHLQNSSVGEEDGTQVGQEQDVVEALRSKQKD